ncbi:MAG: tetratricopeptide repeat protein, partial [Planctomycetes bacterium]|nr:tetratricopeptide repeat protein [Planctomycetota bacterium]
MCPGVETPSARGRSDLDVMDFSQLFQSLATSGKDGTLRVTDGEESVRYVHFRGGAIELVHIPGNVSLVCKALIKSGLVSEDAMRAAMAEQKRRPVPLRTLVLTLGLATEEQVQWALEFQVTEEVCELFTWPRVRCEFQEGEPSTKVFPAEAFANRVAMDPQGLVLEAARRVDEWQVLRETLPSARDVYRATFRCNRYFEHPDRFHAEREVLSLADGLKDAGEVADYARMSSFEAFKVLRGLVEAGGLEPVDSTELLRLGDDCYQRGLTKKAIRLYERAEELGAERPDVPYRVAACYEAQGLSGRAVARYLDHGSRALARGDADGAVASFQKVVELDPRDAESRRLLVHSLAGLGRSQETVPHWSALVEHHRARGEVEEEVEALKGLLAADPADRQAFEALSGRLRASGDTITAIVEFTELATRLQTLGRVEDALATLGRVMEFDEGCVEAHIQAAGILTDVGRTEDAVRAYNRLADNLVRSGVIESSGNWEFLINIYERIVALAPDNQLARQWLANAYDNKKESDKAVAHWTGIAQTLRGSGQEAALLEPLRKIAEITPGNRAVRLELAGLLRRQGRTEEALAEYHALAEFLLSQKDHAGSEAAYRAILEVSRYDPRALRGLGNLFRHAGDTARAVEQLAAAARLCAAAGDYAEGLASAQALLEVAPRDPVGLEVAAEALHRQGRGLEAARALEKLTDAHLERMDIGAARRACQRIAEVDPENSSVEARRQRVEEREALLTGRKLLQATLVDGQLRNVIVDAGTAAVAPATATPAGAAAVQGLGMGGGPGLAGTLVRPDRSMSAITRRLRSLKVGSAGAEPPEPPGSEGGPEAAPPAVARHDARVGSALSRLKALRAGRPEGQAEAAPPADGGPPGGATEEAP